MFISMNITEEEQSKDDNLQYEQNKVKDCEDNFHFSWGRNCQDPESSNGRDNNKCGNGANYGIKVRELGDHGCHG